MGQAADALLGKKASTPNVDKLLGPRTINYSGPGGGQYVGRSVDNVVQPQPRGYANLPAQQGQQRDHIFPVSLGGTSSPANLRYTPARQASQRDAVEKYVASQLRNKKTTLGAARNSVLNYQTTDVPGQRAPAKSRGGSLYATIPVGIAENTVKGIPKATIKVGGKVLNFFTQNTQNLIRTAVENLGSAAAYHLVPEVKKAVDAGLYTLPPMKESQGAGLKKIVGEAIGSGAELASFATGAKVAATAGKVGTRQLALQGAKVGAKYGAAFGVGQSLQENKNIAQTAKSGLTGAATGAAAGAILSPIIGKIAQRGKAAKEAALQAAQDTGTYVGGVTLPAKASQFNLNPKNIKGEIYNSTIKQDQLYRKSFAEVPGFKDKFLQKSGDWQPQVARDRIRDVAQKLDDAFPGKHLGERLMTDADMYSLNAEKLQKVANNLVDQVTPIAPTHTIYRSIGKFQGEGQPAFGPATYVTTDKGVAQAYNAQTGKQGILTGGINLSPKKILDLSRQEDMSAFTLRAIKKYPLGVGKTGESIKKLALDEGYQAIQGDEFTGMAIIDPNVLTGKLSLAQQGLTPTSRVKQSVVPELQKQIEANPQFTQRINELSGGRIKTNPETLQAGLKAVQEGRVTVNTIANHVAGTPVNEDTVAAAALIKDHYEQQWVDALNKGDANAADQANQVLQKIAPGYNNLTATPGRATQIQSQFSEDRLSKLYQKMRDLQAKQVPFKQVQKQLDSELQLLRKTEQMSKLGQRGKDMIRAIENYATGAKLTSPVTHGINTVSNALVFGPVRGPEKYVKAGVQYLQGRPIEAQATAKYAFGTRMGLRNGLQRFSQTLVGEAPDFGLKAEFQQQAPGKIQQFAAEHPKLAVTGRLVNPFRWLSAADNFWKGVIQDAELHTKAYAAVKTEGLTGKAFSQKVTDLVNHPPTAWTDDAAKVAQEYTFQEDPDRFLKAVAKIRNLPGGRLIAPFIQTPYNIVKFQLQRSVLGLASPRNISGIAKGGDQAAEAIARLTVGAGLSLGAWQIAQQGQITGAYPNDQKEKTLWEAEDRKPYSVKIGNKWLAYNRFQPVGLYLTQAAALHEALQAGNEKGASAIFSKMLAYTGKAITDLPFVQGMAGVVDAIQDPEHYAEKAVTGTLTGFVPNILRDVRQQTDVVQRQSKGLVQGVKNMVPGLSKQLQPKIDIFGREKKMEQNRALRATKVISTLKETKETKLLRDVGYSPTELTQAAQTLEGRNKSYKLSDQEFTTYKKEVGRATLKAIQQAGKTRGWKDLDKNQKADVLQSLITKYRNHIRDTWKARYLK